MSRFVDLWQRLPVFRDHPPGLGVCFLTEMWERFSYYGMRALLIFYLTRHFLFTDDQAFLIYGAYTSMVYLLPVIGGAVADRWLGSRKAVTFGALLLVAGHFGLAFEGPPAHAVVGHGDAVIERGETHLSLFYLSLALIATGVGFLKTNITTVVGALYAANDTRRDSGFTVFYMGYNFGGALAPLICGWLGETYGWRYGFGLAGVGMLGGLVVFLRGQSLLGEHAEPPDAPRLRERVLPGLRLEVAIYLAGLALVLVVWQVLQRPPVVGHLLSWGGAGLGLFILWFSFWRCRGPERDRLLVCAVLVAFTLGFWAFYEQMGSSLSLFADRMVDREIFGREIPASTLQALPAWFVILLAPAFSALWMWYARRGGVPSTPFKFAAAIAFMGVAFLALAFGASLREPAGKVALVWFVMNFFLMVAGELCLAPVGMAMITRLSPARIVGTMMGSFLFVYSAASYIAGLIARWTSVETVDGEVVDLDLATETYVDVFVRLGSMALGVALLLYLLSPWLESRMHGAERGRDSSIARLYRKLSLLPAKEPSS